MRYRIDRIERANFSGNVREHHFECRVAPWDDAGQHLEQLEVSVEPTAEVASHRDCCGNQVHRAALLGPHDACVVRMVAEVETRLANPFEFDTVSPERELAWIADSLHQAPRLWDFVLHRSALTPALDTTDGEVSESLLPDAPVWRPGVALLTQMQDACDWVQAGYTHDPGQAPADALTEPLERRTGCSADLAHLLIAVVRSWRMPARFVSGYLDAGYFEPDDDEPDDTAPRPQTLHCWMEVLIPGGGWRGVDPAQGLVADDTYVRLAVGRDLRDVTGFRQSFKGDGEFMGVDTEIDVRRLS
jgi:transglutaminase-like putative cysteine protease